MSTKSRVFNVSQSFSIRLLAFAVLPIWMFAAHAQVWKGILDSSRAIDWRATGAANVSESRTQCGSTLLPSGLDDTVAINSAIAACGQHQFVLLGRGTFIVSNGITFGAAKFPVNNVTLRGSGPLQTTIRFTGADGCGGTFSDVCINNSTRYFSGSPQVMPGGSNAANWTAKYVQGTTRFAQGTTQITLDNVSGLAPSSGSMVSTLILDQPNDEAGILATPNGASEIRNIVTIKTTRPHGFHWGQSVYVDNVGQVNIGASGATEVGATVTINTTDPHGFSVGQTACIRNVDVSQYNGTVTVLSVPNPTTFTYSASVRGLASSGWGTVDPCYNNSSGSQAAYTITSIPSPTSFTYTSPYAKLAPSGALASGYPATAAVDTGGMLVCQTGGLCRATGNQGAEGRQVNGSYSSQAQIVKVVGVQGNTVTISPGLYATNWGDNGKTLTNGRSPGAWWTGPQVTGDAVENMTLDHSASANETIGISFVNAYNCWVSNVRSLSTNEAHVRFMQSAHNTVTSSYFYGVSHSAHSSSYGVEEHEASDDLIVNNIFQHVSNPVLLGSTTGTVVAYNFAADNFYTVSPWMAAGSQLHDTGDSYVLFEGNEFPGIKADYIHGTHALNTLFRNHLSGVDTNLYNGQASADTKNGTIPITLVAHARFFNVIGNVLGTAGYHVSYESSQATDPTGALVNANKAVYTLGWGSTQDSCSYTVCDPITYTSLMRWGNYDVATGSAKWNSAEVPSTIGVFGNAIPATNTLPASLFLSSPPAFWPTPFGTPPWPAIGPDVTGESGPSGHVSALPAQRCYQYIPIDPTYQGTPIPITGASWSSNNITINFPGADTLTPTAVVTVSGVNPAGYNGTYGINGQTSTSISLANNVNPGGYISGGTITYTPNIRGFDAAACYSH